MTPSTYREIRQSLGSQAKVAERLDVDPQTISNRERGVYPITREAALAITHLAMTMTGPANLGGPPSGQRGGSAVE